MAKRKRTASAKKKAQSPGSQLRETLKQDIMGKIGGKAVHVVGEAAPPRHVPPWDKWLARFGGSVRRSEILAFYEELALLTEYGMPLVQALNTLANRVENASLAHVIADIRENVEKGAAFSSAAARHPQHFPPLIISMFRAGEQSGSLVKALHIIADRGERLAVARHRAITSLIYPVLVVLAGAAVVAAGFSFLGTTSEEFMESLGPEVPWTMGAVLAFSEWFRSGTFWLILVLAIVAVVVGYRIAMKSPVARLLRDRFLVRCPFIKHFVKENLIANFARVFETMLEAGVPLQEALDATRDTTHNELLRQAITRVQESVSEGGRITPALERAGVFPPVAYDLAAIGEEAAELEHVFARMADLYEEKIATDTAAFSKLIFPIAIALIGLVIGFTVVALFSSYIAVLEQLHVTGGL